MNEACHITTFQCLGTTLGWIITIERLLVCAAYYLITQRWINAAKHTVGTSRALWISLAWIFRFCALCGYGLPALAGWYPYYSYHLDAYVAMPLLLIACGFFLAKSKNCVLMAERADVLLAAAASAHLSKEDRESLQTVDEAKKALARLMK